MGAVALSANGGGGSASGGTLTTGESGTTDCSGTQCLAHNAGASTTCPIAIDPQSSLSAAGSGGIRTMVHAYAAIATCWNSRHSNVMRTMQRRRVWRRVTVRSYSCSNQPTVWTLVESQASCKGEVAIETPEGTPYFLRYFSRLRDRELSRP